MDSESSTFLYMIQTAIQYKCISKVKSVHILQLHSDEGNQIVIKITRLKDESV